MRGRASWLGAALLVFGVSTWLAWRQPPRPDPLSEPALFSADWWLFPRERNPEKRLPVILSDLNRVFILPGTTLAWAVGSGGIILHSPDAGRTWVQQSPKPARPAGGDAAASSVGSLVRGGRPAAGCSSRRCSPHPSSFQIPSGLVPFALAALLVAAGLWMGRHAGPGPGPAQGAGPVRDQAAAPGAPASRSPAPEAGDAGEPVRSSGALSVPPPGHIEARSGRPR
ncbi:MAG TPA: hypothetical protein VJV23_00185 [Candidatus Polarisedimenticolia bacterium]|nr:hypothetical protein [Candidatus Polarisedimenticolia bacterium]